MKKIIIAIFVFIFCVSASKSIDLDSIKPNFGTPYHTIFTHWRYLEKDIDRPEIAAKALAYKNSKSDEAQDLAIKLKQIFVGKFLYINFDKLPRDSNYKDSSGNNKFYPFTDERDIYLIKVGNNWLYSDYTIEKIPAIYKSVYKFKTDRIYNFFPDYFDKEALGLALWQWTLILGLIILLSIPYFGVSIILGATVSRLLRRFKQVSVSPKHLKASVKPLAHLTCLIIIKYFTPALQLPQSVAVFIGYGLKIFFPLLSVFIIYRLLDVLSDYFQKIVEKTPSKVDDQLLPLARKALKSLTVLGGAIYILQNLDINITPLLAGVSIGGLALALAAQETVKNLFGSITIFVDQPFKVGDWIIFENDKEGVVEEIGVRSTRIRTFYDSILTIPNGKLSDILIDNMGERKLRRFRMNLHIKQNTPADIIEAFVNGIREIMLNTEFVVPDMMRSILYNIGPSSIEILVQSFINTNDFEVEYAQKHKMLSEIIKYAEYLGVELATTGFSQYY